MTTQVIELLCGAEPNPAADWRAIGARAKQLGVFPLIAASAEKVLPADVRTEWRDERRIAAARSLLMCTEHERLSAAFEGREVNFHLLKGPPLGKQLYGDASLRPSTDLDYTVPGPQLQSAANVLVELGYDCRMPVPLPDAVRRYADPFNPELAFTRVSGEYILTVELHWNSFPAAQPAQWTPEVTAVYLALSGARDLWRPLRSLVDFRDWLLLHREGFDWNAFWDFAGRQSLLTIAVTALQLSVAVLDARVSPAPAGARGLSVGSMNRLRAWMFDDSERRNLSEYHRLRLALHDSPGMRVRYLSHLMGPKIDDIDPKHPEQRAGPWLRRWGRIGNRRTDLY